MYDDGKLEDGIKDVLEAELGCDVMSMVDVRDFPSLAGESTRNKVIMAATALGINQYQLADVFGVSQPTINEVINRIDPERKMRASKQARRAFLTQMCEDKAAGTIAAIKFDEIKELDALKKAQVAEKLVNIAGNLNQGKHREVGTSRLDMLIQQADVEATDAPYEESHGKG